MQKIMKKALSFVLTVVIVFAMLSLVTFADEAQTERNSDLPTTMEGLSIAYPYNTETIQLTQTPVSRFEALTFESARQEVESAQMILTPDFNVTSFELKMNDMYNENGNLIPSYAFEVYIQHYYNATGTTNTPNFGDFKSLDYNFITNRTYVEDVFHPRSGGGEGWSGVYPDAIIPQSAAIAAGENSISAGQNKGIWVNLNVGAAAPGTYTGFATLTVNGSAMQIPVSIRIYDVEVPEEVHTKTSIGIWWDQLQAGEGYISQELADSYYDYLVSKRIQPWSQYNHWYTTEGLVEYVVEKATDPKVSNYLLYYTATGRQVDRASVVTTLTAIINKNIELVQSGRNVDLFKKAYFYFTNVDEPAGGSSAPTYAEVQATINVLDSVKAELAPMLADYPTLQESFLGIANIVTGPNPTDRTFHMDGCPDYSDSAALTSTYNSYIYAPQYQYMQTSAQRNLYAGDAEVWWYGCCHPINPYPTLHINSPLVNSRALGFMMYEYGISGQIYSSANYWGAYSNDTIVLYDYWNGFQNYTPGDQILVYPGSDYGVTGPIGSIRIESIRESNEDYEYLWMLENQFGVSDISTYTAGLYDGTIVTGVYDGQTVCDGSDANVLYHTRRIALLSKLEELNVAANGATEIEPGQENFVRGTAFDAGVGTIVKFEEANYAAVTFDYKLTNEGNIAVVLRSPTDVPYYGVYYFVPSGEMQDYSGITTEKLSDGYIRVTMNAAMLDYTNSVNNRDKVPATINKLDILSWATTGGYVDNVQVLTDASDIFTPETKANDLIHMTVFENASYTTAAYGYVDNYLKAENSSVSLKVNTASNVHLTWDLRKEDGGKLDLSKGTLSAYFHFSDGNPFAQAQIYDSTWASGKADFTFEALGDGWYYGTLKTISDGYSAINPANAILLRLWFNKGTTIYVDGLSFEKLVDKNDMFTGGAWLSGSSWTTGTNMTYTSDCTEVYGEDSISSWKFSATAANSNQWAQFMMGMTQSYDMRDYDLVFDAKVDGVESQQLSIRPRTDADGAKDPCNNTVVTMTGGWNTYTVDFAAALKSTSTVDDLTVVQRIFLVFNFAASTGSDRSVIIDNVRLVEKACQHKNTTTTTVDATCSAAGSVTVTCDKCGEIISTEEIPALEHSYDSAVTASSFTANGYTTYTCSACGHSYVGDEVAAYTFDVVEWNITLADDIRANFHLNVDSRLNDALVTVLVDDNGYCYNLSELSTMEEGYYVVSANAAAAQMTDDITIQVTYGDVSSQVKTYSIREYAVYILTNSDEENTKLLVQRMLNYGAAAQNYFSYNTENPANAGYEMTDVPTIPEAESGSTASGAVEGISYYGASLLFETRIGVRFYFTVTGDVNDYTFSNGAKANYKGGMYYVDVLNINPNEYDDIIELSVTDGTDTLTVGYSPLRYISRKYHGSDNSNLVALVGAMYQYHMAAELYLGEDQIVYRGQPFTAGKDTYFYQPEGDYNVVSFEYKTIGDGELAAIIRGSSWTKYYGDFRLTQNGEKVDYPGVTTEVLEDGYVRVTFDLPTLNRTGCVDNLDLAPTDIGLIDIFGAWTTVDGYIDNIQLSKREVYRGQPFTAAKDTYYYLDAAGDYDILSFDYKTEGTGELAVIIRGSIWSTFYGDFRLTETWEKVDYEGITTELLEDGYIRATFDLKALQRSVCVNNRDGAPVDIKLIDIYNWTTVNGYIDNIQVSNKPEEEAIRGESFTGGVTKTKILDSDATETLRFDYKLTTDGDMHLILRARSWQGFYGDFEFNADGEAVDYDGISIEKLSDGYIRVTVVFAELNRTGCANNRDSAPESVGIFDIYSWGTADGYVDNIQLDP